MTAPDTPDLAAARAWKPQIDPGIGYMYGRARQRLRSQFDNPLGADTPAAVRDAAIYAGENEIEQEEGQAYREAYNDQNQQEWNKLSTLAGMTKPEIVGLGTTTSQSGATIGETSGQASGSSTGTSTGSTVETRSALDGLLGGLSNVGLAFA